MSPKEKNFLPAATTKNTARILRRWRRWLPVGLASGLPQLMRGENQVDYRYEQYIEDGDRMTINTHSAYFEQQLVDAIIAKGELTYDSVSGATPTGTLLPSGKIALTHMSDIRRAISLELDTKLGNNTITPGFAYSKESDYESYGLSLNDAIEFNEKNTTLQFGASHNFDSVRLSNETTWEDKQSTEAFIGVSQLLSPKTIFNTAFTFGNDSGYLNDPYRQAYYTPIIGNITLPGYGIEERRPSHRNKEIVYTSLTQYFESINASIEGSYRFYHDTYGISAHTAQVMWHQWLGKHFILEPMFRYYKQSAANFYATSFSGPFILPPDQPPGMHSSDYRLSELYTLDYGAQLTIVLNDHLRAVAGYHRYDMEGTDGITNPGMYPKANIYTIGFSILW